MHFGNSPRTAETERRMAAWSKANPDASVSDYNRAYTTMWNSLDQFSDKEVIATDNPVFEETTIASNDYLDHKDELRGAEAKRLSGGKRPPRYRRPATKGAFGKKR